jgi:hypothetical protein
MMRQTRAHHMVLSQAADAKANMLITISAIAIPLTLNAMSSPEFRLPGVIVITGCITTVCFAAYAAMPKLRPNKGAPDTERPTFNPMFFGDFVGVPYERYLEVMERALATPSTVHEVQLREVWTMGHYLAKRKYLPLRFAYLSFILGIVLSALSWGVQQGLALISAA